MKKIFTLISMIFASVAMMAQALIPDQEYKTLDDLKAATSGFAIVNKADGKAFYGIKDQNLAYDTYENAFDDANPGYLWKIVDADGDGYYLQLITPTGADYNCWGMGGVLNSQGEGQDWLCSFILGVSDKRGQDIKDGAVWVLTYSEENAGWSLKNLGTGEYQSFDTKPAHNADPSYFQFVSLKENPDAPVEQEVEILASLKSFVDNGTIFSLKTGDQFLYGSEAQKCAMGTYEQATAETAAVTGWKLEYQALGGRYIFRAITPAGETYTHEWAKGEGQFCFLNTQPALNGETFILGKNQDVKDGSSWIIAEVEGGYTIQNMANKGYLAGLGLSEEPVVWQFYTPAPPAPSVPEGCVDVAALTGTYSDWASKVTYPKTFAVQGEAFGDGNGDKESTHVSVADYEKITFVVSQGSAQGLGLRVWMWDGSQVVTLFAHPEAEEATADFTQEYLIKEPGNYVVKFNGIADMKGVKAANNWGADPIVVDLAYVTPKAVTTSINAVSVKAQDKAVKALVNGQLVIVKGNDKFNVAGQLVK